MFDKATIRKNDTYDSLKWNVQLYKNINDIFYYCGNGQFFHTLKEAKIYAQKNAQILEIIEG